MNIQQMDDRGDPLISVSNNIRTKSRGLQSTKNMKSTTTTATTYNNIASTTKACKIHFNSSTKDVQIRQIFKGCCQELLGCEPSNELKFFKNIPTDGNSLPSTEFAYAREESSCFCRICCSSIHPYTMSVRDVNNGSELFTLKRPLACNAGPCKCCCYQRAFISSQDIVLGTVEETFYCCIPSFLVRDFPLRRKMYTIHPPTCCGGMCVNWCTEGNPCCGNGCCKVPFWIYNSRQYDNEYSKAEPIGKIVKQGETLGKELFTDANTFDVVFPSRATVEQKAILSGCAIFFNSLFFESG